MIKKFNDIKKKYNFSDEQLQAIEEMFCMDKIDKKNLSNTIILKMVAEVIKERGLNTNMSEIVGESAKRLNKNVTTISVTLGAKDIYKKNLVDVMKYADLW